MIGQQAHYYGILYGTAQSSPTVTGWRAGTGTEELCTVTVTVIERLARP